MDAIPPAAATAVSSSTTTATSSTIGAVSSSSTTTSSSSTTATSSTIVAVSSSSTPTSSSSTAATSSTIGAVSSTTAARTPQRLVRTLLQSSGIQIKAPSSRTEEPLLSRSEERAIAIPQSSGPSASPTEPSPMTIDLMTLKIDALSKKIDALSKKVENLELNESSRWSSIMKVRDTMERLSKSVESIVEENMQLKINIADLEWKLKNIEFQVKFHTGGV